MAGSRKLAVMNLMRLALQHSTAEGRFGHVFKQVELVDGDIGRCVVKVKVTSDLVNSYDTLHGGASATLVDQVTTIALCEDDPESLKKLGVSVSMNMEYFKAGKVGQEVLVDGKVIKKGRTMAFTEAELRNAETQELLAKGSHVKYVG